MELRPLGHTGVSVSQFCLGAMMFGAWGNPDHDEAIRIIHRALEAGDLLQLGLFTRLRGRGILRSSPLRSPRKVEASSKLRAAPATDDCQRPHPL